MEEGSFQLVQLVMEVTRGPFPQTLRFWGPHELV
jgi:hypothetical protein